MPRPKIARRICCKPGTKCFKPIAIPLDKLVQVNLEKDELEALRLVDQEGMQQQQAAVEMQVSRQTLANIVKSARKKVTNCILEGKALMLDES